MTVMVGYIPTPEGEAAVERGIEEAVRRDAPLIVVNTRRDDIPADSRRLHEVEASRLRERLEGAGVRFEIVAREQARQAADGILDVIDQRSPDLLVIGVRQRTAVAKLILGSTAQRLILEAPCPVLTVKPTSGSVADG
jgi:nucleotide-binding universal stress UspA family protein